MFEYKKILSCVAASIVFSAFFAEASEAARVAGASIVEKASRVEDVLYDLLAQPLTQEEIDLFLKHAATVLQWAEENSKEWLAADESDNPLATIRTFDIWNQVDVTSSEFVSLVGKLMFAKEFSDDPMNEMALKQEMAQMSAIYNSGQLTPEQETQVREVMAQMTGLLKVLQNGAEQNVVLYKKNKTDIDAALDRFEAIDSETTN